jgi:diguanylate cyclase (GGDEF)-like protein/PAS domain S-box-containing protein
VLSDITGQVSRLIPPLPHSLRLPVAPFARVRLFFLATAGISMGVTQVTTMTGPEILPLRLAGVALGFVLFAYWVLGYKRERFPVAAELLEAAALLAILRLTPGEPFLPLFGLVYRGLYGSPRIAVARYLLWVGALLGGHAHLGHAHLQSDLARATGLALAPLLMQALSSALRSSEASQRRLRSLVQNSTDVMTVVGDDLLVRWQAESIRAVLGQDPERIVGEPMLDLVHPDDRPELQRYFAEAGGHPDHTRSLTVRMRHGDGGHRPFDVVASNRLHDQSVEGFVLNLRDATERDRLERELRALAAQREHDATHDPLTGLANRRRLFARLEDAIAEARTRKTKLPLLLIDLDHFKELNDTLGHAAGDRLLREIRPRLLAGIPEADLVARVGGDEFAVLLPPGFTAEQAEQAATRLQRRIEEPFHFQGLTLLVRASVGIAVFPEHGRDVETLMQRADIAMYSAKGRGVGHEVYSASRDGHSRARLALIGELPEAIASGQIVPYFQPKFDLASGEMIGAEALVRWDHPQYGLLGPGAFLPLAEQTGLMRPLTLRVLDDALAQCARWIAEGRPMSVAVNLSAPNLLDIGLPGDVSELLAKWNVEPGLLQLEITETIVAADPVRVIEIMKRLGALGVTLSLDDFGTGSSSLAYLRELPVQELKIDKSFILGMEGEPQAATIVRTIAELARNLGLRSVGEGIETEEARALLASCGCDYGQGFLLGRPMPADELNALVQAAAAQPLPALPLPRSARAAA